MLVTRRGNRLALITQPDHGRLAGQLGAHWGNSQFATPAAREALLCAATHHDDGWHELDGVPAHNAQAQRPAHFVELPLRQTVGPYGRGVESVYARDPHAGALVGMHFSGFYTGRWGLQDAGRDDNPLAGEVVATQEARWMPALREVWGYRGPRSEFDADTWHAYELLQGLDLLSLALGLIDLERPTEAAEAVGVPATLRKLDQPPGPRIVPAVPTAPGHRVELRLRVAAPGRVELDPYPFDDPEFEVTLPMRQLDDRPYDSADESARAYHAAIPIELRCAVTAA